MVFKLWKIIGKKFFYNIALGPISAGYKHSICTTYIAKLRVCHALHEGIIASNFLFNVTFNYSLNISPTNFFRKSTKVSICLFILHNGSLQDAPSVPWTHSHKKFQPLEKKYQQIKRGRIKSPFHSFWEKNEVSVLTEKFLLLAILHCTEGRSFTKAGY